MGSKVLLILDLTGKLKGKHPLECKIKKLQYTFWTKITRYAVDNPDSAIAKVLKCGSSCTLAFIRYYNGLLKEYSNPSFCQMKTEADFRKKWKLIINQKASDPDSKLGTYLLVNPELKPYVTYSQGTMECERIIITRFRTGSHSLAIELGRFSNIPRQNRLCACKRDIQSVLHVFKECPLTTHIHNGRFDNLKEVFNAPDIGKLLLKITSVLKVAI